MQKPLFVPSRSNWLESAGTLTFWQRNKLFHFKTRPSWIVLSPILSSCMFKIWHFSAQEAIPFISAASPMRVLTGLKTKTKGHQEIEAGVCCELAFITAGGEDSSVATGVWACAVFLISENLVKITESQNRGSWKGPLGTESNPPAKADSAKEGHAGIYPGKFWRYQFWISFLEGTK